jgi:acetyl-CoA carboxylase biotin carboxyl carrier protein
MKKPSGPRTEDSAQGSVDVAAIDQLAKIASEYELTEIEIDTGVLRIRLERQRSAAGNSVFAPATQARSVSSPAAETPIPSPEPEEDLAGAVRSPMVGTAYLRPTPETKPFVEVGSLVKAGDKLLLVEAMKTFNDIVAPRAGRIVSILVADGAPVEYGQPLMIIQ